MSQETKPNEIGVAAVMIEKFKVTDGSVFDTREEANSYTAKRCFSAKYNDNELLQLEATDMGCRSEVTGRMLPIGYLVMKI